MTNQANPNSERTDTPAPVPVSHLIRTPASPRKRAVSAIAVALDGAADSAADPASLLRQMAERERAARLRATRAEHAAEAARAETEHVAAEARTLRAELQALVEAVPDAIVAFDGDGNLIHANSRGARWCQSTLADQPIADTLLAGARAALGQTDIARELMIVDAGGHRRTVRLVAVPLPGKKDQPPGVVAVAREIADVCECGSIRQPIDETLRTTRRLVDNLTQAVAELRHSAMEASSSGETQPLASEIAAGAAWAERIMHGMSEIVDPKETHSSN